MLPGRQRWWLFPLARENCQWLYYWREWHFFPQPTLAVYTMLWMINVDGLNCAGLFQTTTFKVSSWMPPLYHAQKTLFHSTPPQPLTLTCFLSSLPPCSQSLWGQRVIKVSTVKTKHSTDVFSTLTMYKSTSTKKQNLFLKFSFFQITFCLIYFKLINKKQKLWVSVAVLFGVLMHKHRV